MNVSAVTIRVLLVSSGNWLDCGGYIRIGRHLRNVSLSG
jgi:hypothetical protein